MAEDLFNVLQKAVAVVGIGFVEGRNEVREFFGAPFGVCVRIGGDESN